MTTTLPDNAGPTQDSGPLHYQDASTLAALIATKQASSRDVVQAHLDRIAEVNPKINAIVTLVADDALRNADAADAAVAADAADAAVASGAELGRSPTRLEVVRRVDHSAARCTTRTQGWPWRSPSSDLVERAVVSPAPADQVSQRFSLHLDSSGQPVIDDRQSTARNMLLHSGGHVIRRWRRCYPPEMAKCLVSSCEIPTAPSSDRRCLHVAPSGATETLCFAPQQF
jgi:hypothetical protein